uniref:Uncharacterized protein n=1 Tax=Chaetoceros debilis TaxID=122233 RepID=A0A7S3PX51_9STRA|mmetsp:Transcript_19486/g.29508  ORF Transcript_19486/g.29508 Transcript_19486/m.29508 type:complete len:106 (+) Transcript_19486:120-437(+)
MSSNIINASSTIDADVITAKPFTETSNQILRGIVEADFENKVEPYSMVVELTAKYASFRDRGKTTHIIASSAAIISIISSVILLWMIRRSHIGLSSTYHRLLLGL